jgi:multidrug efflux system membrane fusion protein
MAEPQPVARILRTRLRRVITVGVALLGVIAAWEILTYFVAYTDDAYVRSDLVGIAPQVTGPIVALYVVDNQDVKRGDKLFTIDPTPFQLEVNQHSAQIAEEQAMLKLAKEELTSAKDALDAATAANTFADQEQKRYAVLAKQGGAPVERLERANDELRRTTAETRMAEVAVEKAQTGINVHQAALEKAKAEMAISEWKLDQTQVVSPTDGAITNLTIRVGDMAKVDVPMIGIVDAHAWRIMANYKQYYVRDLTIGGTAWVWLDSYPWHFFRARVTGIARGISREPEMPKLLPYVAPTTDWIRLQRRIPVTIVLDELPPGGKLYMGADARTVIFP